MEEQAMEEDKAKMEAKEEMEEEVEERREKQIFLFIDISLAENNFFSNYRSILSKKMSIKSFQK